MTRTLGVVALMGLALAPTAYAAEGSIEDLRRLFDYDAKQTLDAKEKLLTEKDGVRTFDLSYASPKG